ncbi:hypothetical protein ACFLV7_13995 [Chloroflexota bacterium]
MVISLSDLAPKGPPSEIDFQVFERELESRDLSDLIEIHNYNDGDMHSKALLIDNEFVVIGSQNFSTVLGMTAPCSKITSESKTCRL